MMKSKRRTMMFSTKQTKAQDKVDSFHNWEYSGFSKSLGNKYEAKNALVTKSSYYVTKGYKHGVELVDV